MTPEALKGYVVLVDFWTYGVFIRLNNGVRRHRFLK
jgi:hypothetical protein